ncbi:hypothetical protein BX666DRAFT_1856841 [Dichotomocladium elegans]|nr:hypothetical protein BX666DRAFT_1856841 [Dichotomocladium elegans]
MIHTTTNSSSTRVNQRKHKNNHNRRHSRRTSSASRSNDLQTKATSSRMHHTENSHAGLPTPPPSPLTLPENIDDASVSDAVAKERLLAAKRQGHLKGVISEYTSIKRDGYIVLESTYHLVIEAHACLRREGTPITPMLQVYHDMLNDNIEPTPATFTLVILALCKRDVEVQKTVAMLKRQSARASDFLLGPAAVADLEEDVASLQSENSAAKALAVFTSAVATHGAGAFSTDLLDQLLRVLSHHGDTEGALTVYNHMSSPTSITYASLINVFGRAKNIKSVQSTFDEYKTSSPGEPRCAQVYGAMVDAYLKCGEVEEALRMVEHTMTEDGVKITAVPFNTIIRHYCSVGDMTRAKEVVASMTVPKDASTYGPILTAYCQADALDEATEMYDAILKQDLSKAYGNLANYAVLCLRCDAVERALQVVTKDMRAAGLEPDQVLSEQLLTYLLQREHITEAMGALVDIVDILSPRSLAKAAPRLINPAAKILATAQALGKARLSDMLVVSRALANALSTMPLALATPIMDCYGLQKKTDRVSVKDFSVLCEAGLVAIQDNESFASCVVELLWSFQERNGCMSLSSDLAARVLERLERAKHEEAIELWKETMTGNGQSAELARKVHKAVARGEYDVAIRYLKEKTAKVVPTAEPIRDAIALAGKQGFLAAAEAIYDLSVAAFRAHLDTARAARAVYLATNSILIGCAQQGDMAKAKTYYDIIKGMGQYPDGNAYASLLVGAANTTTDEATDALVIYEEAKRHHIKPTTFFYNVVISKLAKARKLEPALRLFDEMQTLFKLTPNAITYGAIISACVRAGSEAQAVRLFDEMLVHRVQPRIGPFNNMIQFYVRQQPNRERALYYFSELRRHRLTPSAHTYKLLMEAHAMIAPYAMDTAHRLLDDMFRDDTIRPQPTHYATLIYAYGTLQKDVKKADRVFAQAVETCAGDNTLETAYQAMLDTLITNNQLERAESVYEQMTRSIKKSASPYIENLLLRGYGQKGWVRKAEKLFERMSDKTSAQPGMVVREPSTYEAMVRAYLDNGMIQKAKATLDRMASHQFPEKVVAAVSALIRV